MSLKTNCQTIATWFVYCFVDISAKYLVPEYREWLLLVVNLKENYQIKRNEYKKQEPPILPLRSISFARRWSKAAKIKNVYDSRIKNAKFL